MTRTDIPFDPVEHADRAIEDLVLDLRNAIKTCETCADAIRLSARIDVMVGALSTVGWDALRRADDLLKELKVAS